MQYAPYMPVVKYKIHGYSKLYVHIIAYVAQGPEIEGNIGRRRTVLFFILFGLHFPLPIGHPGAMVCAVRLGSRSACYRHRRGVRDKLPDAARPGVGRRRSGYFSAGFLSSGLVAEVPAWLAAEVAAGVVAEARSVAGAGAGFSVAGTVLMGM